MGRVASDRTMQQDSAPGSGTTWNPFDAFRGGARCEYAVIVLNRPIRWRHDELLQFWQEARITVTVDGGTHRWLKYLEEQGIDISNDEHEQYIPDLVTGDMDSCPLSVIEKLGSMGSTIVETPDQNHTDYTKALLQVAHYARTHNINLGEIYVLAETSGRFDHIIGNVNTLYKSDKLVGNIQVEFLSGDTSREQLSDMDVEAWFAQHTYTRDLGATEILVRSATVWLSC